MLLPVTIIATAALYLFAPLNHAFFRLKISQKTLKIIRVTHFVLLAMFAFLVFLFLSGKNYYFIGRYTNYLVFWGLLMTGFALAAFKPGNLFLKYYLFLFQFVWVFAIIVTLVVPLLGLWFILPLTPFATPPGKVEYNSSDFRIEVNNEPRFMAPKFYRPYFLIEKKGIIEIRHRFSAGIYCEGNYDILSADVQYMDNKDSALVTMRFKQDCEVSYDSIANTISKKVELN